MWQGQELRALQVIGMPLVATNPKACAVGKAEERAKQGTIEAFGFRFWQPRWKQQVFAMSGYKQQ